MDTEKAMDMATEGAKAVTKLQEILQKIFGPLWTRKQADADEYADKKKIETIRENPDMDIEYIDGKINVKKKTTEALIYRAEQRKLQDEIRQENNIEKVIELASEEAKNSKRTSSEPVDEDWIVRFFNIIKDVSNEEMHVVWSKILAGEIESPGSFSMRTLDLVSNINKREAETFQKALPFVVRDKHNYFIFAFDNLLEKHGVDYEDILMLSESGLINRNTSVNPVVSENKNVLFFNQTITMVLTGKNDCEEIVRLNIYPLTRSGRELYELLNNINNIEYIADCSKQIEKQNSNVVTVSVHKVISVSGDHVFYERDQIN